MEMESYPQPQLTLPMMCLTKCLLLQPQSMATILTCHGLFPHQTEQLLMSTRYKYI